MVDESAVDFAHVALVSGLLCAFKPASVLELGYGTGRVTEAIVAALRFNRNPSTAYVVVDNWGDHGGTMPEGLEEKHAGWPVRFETANEEDYVKGFAANVRESARFEFIFSDADHASADQWFWTVYARVLAPGGILIYHDINIVENHFANLQRILRACEQGDGGQPLMHKLFNRNSRLDERCQRGLLMIWKPDA